MNEFLMMVMNIYSMNKLVVIVIVVWFWVLNFVWIIFLIGFEFNWG